MANQALYDSSRYHVPGSVLAGVRRALAGSPEGSPGGQRARTLLADPTLSYSAAKRIKSDLEQPGASSTPGYELAGGRAMLAWLNQALTQARQTETRRKTTRTNAGSDNQFRRAHEKNGHAAPVSASASSGRFGGVRRQELYEDAPAGADPGLALAQALQQVFPGLSFERNAEDGTLVLLLGPLSVTITAQ